MTSLDFEKSMVCAGHAVRRWGLCPKESNASYVKGVLPNHCEPCWEEESAKEFLNTINKTKEQK